LLLLIKKTGIYSILADKTSRKEQLSFVVRCVDVDTANMYEHFLTFAEAATLNAESLCTCNVFCIVCMSREIKRLAMLWQSECKASVIFTTSRIPDKVHY